MNYISNEMIIRDALKEIGINKEYQIVPDADYKRIYIEVDKKLYWLRLWERGKYYVRYSLFEEEGRGGKELVSSKELTL